MRSRILVPALALSATTIMVLALGAESSIASDLTMKISWRGQQVFLKADITDKNAYRCNYHVRAELADGSVVERKGYSEPRGSGTNLQVADLSFVATVRSASLVRHDCTPKS